MSTIVKTSAFEAALRAECPSFLNKEACKILAENHAIAKLAAKLQVKADDVREQLSVLIRRVSKAELKELMGKAKAAHVSLACIMARNEEDPVSAEDWGNLTKTRKDQPTKKDVMNLRKMLRVPRHPYYFKESDTSVEDNGIVSNPSSPVLALGGNKGSMGPNVIESSDEVRFINVIAPTLEQTEENAERTLKMCKNKVPFVLEAFVELMVSAPDLEPHAAVFKSLFAIVKQYVESEGCSPSDALARVGLEITALCQLIGDASVPRIHSQQLMEIRNVENVFHALSETDHTVDEIAAAVTAYLKAQEHYVSVASKEYEGKFVEIAQVLEVAKSASRESRESLEWSFNPERLRSCLNDLYDSILVADYTEVVKEISYHLMGVADERGDSKNAKRRRLSVDPWSEPAPVWSFGPENLRRFYDAIAYLRVDDYNDVEKAVDTHLKVGSL
jgi:hypothetical protein